MVLLNHVIHVLAGSAFAFVRQELFALEVTDGANVGRVLVDIDHLGKLV